MLETFYTNFGFIGAFALAFLAFLLFIFWITGLTGICMVEESRRKKTIRITIAILIPIYPVLWMILDMIEQKRELSRA